MAVGAMNAIDSGRRSIRTIRGPMFRTTAVVDESLVLRLEAHEKVTRAELQLASVQIWHNKEQQFGLERLERVRGFDDLRKWMLMYDRFLGYMAGVLPLVDGGVEGFIL